MTAEIGFTIGQGTYKTQGGLGPRFWGEKRGLRAFKREGGGKKGEKSDVGRPLIKGTGTRKKKKERAAQVKPGPKRGVQPTQDSV